MRYLKLCAFTLITGLSFVFAAPYAASRQEVCVVSSNSLDVWLQGLVEGDEIPASVQGCARIYFRPPFRYHNLHDLIMNMITLDRVESFRFLIPRLYFDERFESEIRERNAELSKFLKEAIELKKRAFYDVLLAQNFEYILTNLWFFTEVPPLPLADLIDMATRHPRHMKSVTGNFFAMRDCRNFDTAWTMIELSWHCAGISEEFKHVQDHQPGDLLHGLMYNNELYDADMAAVIKRWHELGLIVNDRFLHYFIQHHPRGTHPQTLQAIRDIIQNGKEEVKEPGCD
jgi:hypothetical protein